MDPEPGVTGDAEAIRRARLGDPAAWEALVQRYQEPVFRLAYLLLGSPADADDITQETFLRAYQYLNRFDESRPLRPWLLKIAANLARNQRRSLARRLAAINRWFQSGAPTSSAPAETISDHQGHANLLWQMVGQLGIIDQQMIYLRYFLDLSVEETAEAMSIARGTVKSRLHRALNRLRQVIEREHPDLGDWYDERARI